MAPWRKTSDGDFAMKFRNLAAGMAALVFATPAVAQDISPNLATTVPGSFYTDRYAPTVFQLANGIQGRNNVLQLQAGTDAASRPSGQQATFYNTQGRKIDMNVTGSWMFQSDLFVSSAWEQNNIACEQTGTCVRTDLWATATDDVMFTNPSAYPIMGITNFGALGLRARGYDVNSGLWLDFTNALNPNAWNSLGVDFNVGTNTFNYWVNGVVAGSVVGGSPSTGVANLMYQAYNFNDPSLNISGNMNETFNWSNTLATTVPEPSTYALMGFGLAGMFGIARRKRMQAA